MGQTLSSGTWILLHASTGSLPAPSSITSDDGGDITPLLTSGQGPDGLIIRLRASGGDVTLTDVRTWLREDAEWALLAQAGASDLAFSTLVVPQDLAVKFVVASPARADRCLVQADTISGGTVVVDTRAIYSV